MTQSLGEEQRAGAGVDLDGVTGVVHPTFDGAAQQLVATLARHDVTAAVLVRAEAGWSPVARTVPEGRVDLSAGMLACRRAGLDWVDGGDVVLVVPAGSVAEQRLETVVGWLTLHRQRDDARGSEQTALHAADVVRAVSEQLRSVRNLDEVLHSIARRTMDLLDADICGVMLREDDEVRMRSCVGHRLAETAKLRMRKGQGVAGLVFATGEVGKVDDYLAADTISNDFMSLAGREETRSALAVPLMLYGDLIGVLEVWRRRASVFTELDTQRMLTLADFASIAIANARQYEEQEQTLHQLTTTREALEREVLLSRRLADLQQRLIDTVLRRPTLAGLAEVVADQLGCSVGIYGVEGQQLARAAAGDEEAPESIEIDAGGRPAGSRAGHLGSVVVEGEALGWVLLSDRHDAVDTLDVACNHVAMAVSLAHLHERAASKARAEALEQAMWDLLIGPIESRMAARSRAQQIGYSLHGPHLVAYGRINGLERAGADASSMDQLVAGVLRLVRHDDDAPRQTLVGCRGDHLVAVVPVTRRLDVRALLSQWSGFARGVDGQLSMTWGVSRSHSDAFALAKSYEEAKVALSAALRLGDHNIAMYDDLGIARILLGSGSDPDVQTFVDEVTAPLVAYDESHDGSLVQTLRAFFDANCSQKVAAERLFIHHKTMRYRLDRIHQLTGLDLAQHEHRMRADFALRLLLVHETEPRSTDR